MTTDNLKLMLSILIDTADLHRLVEALREVADDRAYAARLTHDDPVSWDVAADHLTRMATDLAKGCPR